LHFVARDFGAALGAWDLYLALVGQAPLAVEARYNRALCLVRLGDYPRARAALLPIAQGAAGAYRLREARALLARLP
jgi:tetratricopeptide (TPR) repeat protein